MEAESAVQLAGCLWPFLDPEVSMRQRRGAERAGCGSGPGSEQCLCPGQARARGGGDSKELSAQAVLRGRR